MWLAHKRVTVYEFVQLKITLSSEPKIWLAHKHFTFYEFVQLKRNLSADHFLHGNP